MVVPLTRKEFTVFSLVVGSILFVALLIGLIKFTNYRNEVKAKKYVSPEVAAELDEWSKISAATRSIVSKELWYTSENEGRLVASAIEENVKFSIYATYSLEDGSMCDTAVVAGSLDGVYTDAERELLAMKVTNAIATTSAAQINKEESPVASGIILNWQNAEDVYYSLVDINGDGSWDYLTTGKESYFANEGNLEYTDDVGVTTFVDAGKGIEVISPHFTMSEAEEYLKKEL